MSDYIRVAAVNELDDPGRITLEVDDRMVVLLRVEGQFYCIDDVCTHDGGTLGDGPFDEHRVTCPRHGAMFDIRCGKALTMPATEAITCHDVKVEDDHVYVRVNET